MEQQHTLHMTVKRGGGAHHVEGHGDIGVRGHCDIADGGGLRGAPEHHEQ